MSNYHIYAQAARKLAAKKLRNQRSKQWRAELKQAAQDLKNGRKIA